MDEYSIVEERGISPRQLEEALERLLIQFPHLSRVLILPPDYTRSQSCAGPITQILYKKLTARGAAVHVMPALGTHMPMSDREKRAFFAGVVPDEAFLIHRWQTDAVRLGTIPAGLVGRISGGLYREDVEVEVNHRLVDGGYDLILSVGQVVPHEVVGMSNYSKNLFVGVGGRSMINQSHFLAALCGLERALGRVDTPARRLYDYAQQNFIDGRLPVVYLLTVTTQEDGQVRLNGLFVGESRRPFEEAAALSRRLNIVHVPRRAKKVVAYMDPEELKTTWVGGKGIYRTCLMLEDGGELLLLAPGVASFGENREMDALIRKYGYCGRDRILSLYRKGAFGDSFMCAAHLIQGSSEGRFTVTYATCPEKLSQKEVESVGYRWADFYEVSKQYDHTRLTTGWHIGGDGAEFYYVDRPAAGLWRYGETVEL